VNWSKLMQIIRGTGINWREGILISKLYMDQGVKLRLDEAETCDRLYSNETASTLQRNLLKDMHCEICR
jgi:hypothetical protein